MPLDVLGVSILRAFGASTRVPQSSRQIGDSVKTQCEIDTVAIDDFLSSLLHRIKRIKQIFLRKNTATSRRHVSSFGHGHRFGY